MDQFQRVPVLSGKNDFDFLVGSWSVTNRRLKQRHVGCREWDVFPGFANLRPVLGGLGNVEEIDFPTKGWSGVTLRFFSPQTNRWSIYWVNSRDGLMQAPVHGSFNGGVGEFFGEDVDGELPVDVRYRWILGPGSDAARWEQAFSTDAGKTWETNWVMDFVRAY